LNATNRAAGESRDILESDYNPSAPDCNPGQAPGESPRDDTAGAV